VTVAADPYELQRFVDAQDGGGSYRTALAELQAGRKRSHWMWYVFPQLAGLGFSAMAQRYGISGLAEAEAYLAHPQLGPRLDACVRALLDLAGSDPVAVLGPVDAQKLSSSMTLFEAAAAGDPQRAATFGAVLDRYYAGARDAVTLERLGG
jgi:uncharacterized protein (DUF1810 family)